MTTPSIQSRLRDSNKTINICSISTCTLEAIGKIQIYPQTYGERYLCPLHMSEYQKSITCWTKDCENDRDILKEGSNYESTKHCSKCTKEIKQRYDIMNLHGQEITNCKIRIDKIKKELNSKYHDNCVFSYDGF